MSVPRLDLTEHVRQQRCAVRLNRLQPITYSRIKQFSVNLQKLNLSSYLRTKSVDEIHTLLDSLVNKNIPNSSKQTKRASRSFNSRVQLLEKLTKKPRNQFFRDLTQSEFIKTPQQSFLSNFNLMSVAHVGCRLPSAPRQEEDSPDDSLHIEDISVSLPLPPSVKRMKLLHSETSPKADQPACGKTRFEELVIPSLSLPGENSQDDRVPPQWALVKSGESETCVNIADLDLTLCEDDTSNKAEENNSIEDDIDFDSDLTDSIMSIKREEDLSDIEDSANRSKEMLDMKGKETIIISPLSFRCGRCQSSYHDVAALFNHQKKCGNSVNKMTFQFAVKKKMNSKKDEQDNAANTASELKTEPSDENQCKVCGKSVEKYGHILQHYAQVHNLELGFDGQLRPRRKSLEAKKKKSFKRKKSVLKNPAKVKKSKSSDRRSGETL